ncbi:aureocin A53 family class IId bacteriocin [Arthrobacter bambusae]|uniref:aureocin A53 family class IId bacteriocin n=1 Tax=Arthrobacter bambusae TaxID=1338426 RepID=UPI00277F9E77|nr:aureocin A53 family class IId bacteriocin [Arthrobacter bambusae]MDQ0028963.1 phage-related minor tail protein [Arthrobacter bambusae]MDQ0098635.1 phage-related minor tail protein [Arthrobacter bambusae]
MPAIILAVIRAVAHLGSRAVNWVTANWRTILDWLNAGRTIDWVVRRIRDIIGL